MPELKAFLSHVADAATNPLSFVAYIAALISWAFLRAREGRNKNLLSKIKDLPEEDRIKAIREDMGTAPISEGLSSEQWMRSQRHKYFFLSFAIVCAVVVLLFAISAFQKQQTPAVSGSVISSGISDAPPVPEPDPDPTIAKNVHDIDLGIKYDEVVSKLGTPQQEQGFSKDSCAYFKFPFAKLQLWFDTDTKKLIFMYVVATSSKFRPDFFSQYETMLDTQGCLGCFPFRYLSQHSAAPSEDNARPRPSDRPEDDSVPEVVWFNMPRNNGYPSMYVEQYRPAYSWQRLVYIVRTGEGYAAVPKNVEDELFSLMSKWDRKQDFDSFFKALSKNDQLRLIELREQYHPNAYAVAEDLDRDDTQSREVPWGGKLDVVSCQ